MNIEFIGMACALGLSAMGSAFGSGFAAQASVGAWKSATPTASPPLHHGGLLRRAPDPDHLRLPADELHPQRRGGAAVTRSGHVHGHFRRSGHRPVRLLPGQGRPPPPPTLWAKPERARQTTSLSSVLSKRWHCSPWCSACCCRSKSVYPVNSIPRQHLAHPVDLILSRQARCLLLRS